MSDNKPIQIVIIDDDATSMRIESKAIRAMSPEYDFELMQFLDPEVAMRYYRKHPMPEVILCDYEMPVMGPVVMNWFKKKGFKGTSYFVSGHDITMSQAIIVDGIINKPFSLDDIQHVLKKVFENGNG